MIDAWARASPIPGRSWYMGESTLIQKVVSCTPVPPLSWRLLALTNLVGVGLLCGKILPTAA